MEKTKTAREALQNLQEGRLRRVKRPPHSTSPLIQMDRLVESKILKKKNGNGGRTENQTPKWAKILAIRSSGSQIEQNARRAVRSKLNLLEPNARGRSTSFRFRVNSHTFRVNNLKLSTVLNFKRDLGFGGKGL